MITGSKELIRDMNTKLVINAIMNASPISRASIAQKLGLTKATISAIVQVLLDKDLVLEIGSDDTKKGRKPILLELNKNCGYVVAIDLSADYITLLAANLMGENCFLKRYENTSRHEDVIPSLISYIEEMMRNIPKSTYHVVGISLGIHGVVHNNKVVFVPYSPYADIDFQNLLEVHFNIPVVVENEANLSVLGEWAYSCQTKNMLGISVHSGIGIGIIMNDQLLTGQNGYAGEFGHTIFQFDGRECPCGNRGCLEQYGSERALLKELSTRKGQKLSADDFAGLYQKNDDDALAVMELFIKYMSVAVNNLLNTFNPEIIVINSSFTMNFPETVDKIAASLKNTMKGSCRLLPSLLQDTAILLGGVYLCSHHFLNEQ